MDGLEGRGMKELPIIFSTEMVRAILDGRKTMTRRVIKPQPLWVAEPGIPFKTPDADPKGIIKCPYGQKGDRLYVKETWKVDSVDDRRCRMLIDFKAIQDGYSGAEIEAKFTPERYKQFRKFYQKNGWQSPYFMPKEAARLWLDNEGVRVERLQDITEEDAKAEGVKDPYEYQPPEYYEQSHMRGIEYHKSAFAGLWDSINATRGYGWDMNNQLWVVEFRRTLDE
jgi:hypothetical protein